MSEQYLIVGTGLTGQACASYLSEKKQPFVIWDTRETPPGLETLQKKFPGVPIYTGTLPDEIESSIDTLIVSPGVPLNTPVISRALVEGKTVINDIELFARENTRPIIAVTGSNGKSTTVSLLGEMAKACGYKPAVMGNIGKPVLDFLNEDYDLAIMELSSFQLMSTDELAPDVACILNISEDHLDWHGTLDNYIKAKQRIYRHAKLTVCNRDDENTWPTEGIQQTFEPHATDHMESNAKAALCVAQCMGWDLIACHNAIENFNGLPHRLQLIADSSGVSWFNDSKATNPVSAIAGINTIGAKTQGKLILIMGGAAKTKNFDELQEPIKHYAKNILLIGECRDLLHETLKNYAPCELLDTLPQAVKRANELAKPGDAVILSPACTSWDMFKDYAERGECFAQSVKALR